MQRLLPTIGLSLFLLVAAVLYERAKREAAAIDVCAAKETPEARRQCEHAVAFAMSAGW